MKKRINFLLVLFVLLLNLQQSEAQNNTLYLILKNQPNEYIKLGWIKGDEFVKTDSAIARYGIVRFNFPEDAHPGVYRVILGKTTYAKVMNEDPQLLDFIYNNENIAFETDFKHPFDSCKVIRSEENKLWFDVLKESADYQKQFVSLEKEVNTYWNKKETSKSLDAANNFNLLQMEWDMFLRQTMQQNSTLFASKLVALKRLPVQDGFFSPEERTENLKKEYFRDVNFSDEQLIYSAGYTDKIFDFLLLFNHPTYTQDKRTREYIKGVDLIMNKVNSDQNMNKFITDYLIHGFTVLQMDEVIHHIKTKY